MSDQAMIISSISPFDSNSNRNVKIKAIGWSHFETFKDYKSEPLLKYTN